MASKLKWYSSFLEPGDRKDVEVTDDVPADEWREWKRRRKDVPRPVMGVTPALRIKTGASSSLFARDIQSMVEILRGRAVLDLTDCKLRHSAWALALELADEGLVKIGGVTPIDDKADYPTACFAPANDGTLLGLSQVRAKFAPRAGFRFLGAGTYGWVYKTELATRPGVPVALKVVDRLFGASELHDNCKLLPLMLEHHTENFARVYDAFQCALDVENDMVVELESGERPKMFIVEELVGKTFYQLAEEKGLLTGSLVFEEAWLSFICTKYLGGRLGDRHSGNYAMIEHPPFARAYHIEDTIYLMPKDSPMFKRIDASIDSPRDMQPEGYAPLEPRGKLGELLDIRCYEGLEIPPRLTSFYLTSLLRMDNEASDRVFNDLLKTCFATISPERLALLEDSGEEVRHFYA